MKSILFTWVKIKYKYAHRKNSSQDEVFTQLFFFFSNPAWNLNPVFLTGMNSSWDEVSSRGKRAKVRAAWSVFFFIMVVLFHFFFLFYIKFSPEIKEIQCCYFNFQLVNYILLLDSQVGRSWPWDWVKKNKNNQTDQNYLWLESSLIRILLRVICSIRDRPQSSRLILDKFKQLTSINFYPHEIIRNPSVFWWFQGE